MLRIARKVVPLAGGILLLWLLVRQINPRDVIDLLFGVRPGSLLLALLWYALTNIQRAHRFALLLAQRSAAAPWRLLPATFAMNFLNNVLPSRTGELSFPYLLNRYHGVAVGESATVLVLARIYDYLAVACLFVLFALLRLSALKANAARIVIAVAGLLFLTIIALLIAPWLAAATLRGLRWLLRRRSIEAARIEALLAGIEVQIVETLHRVRNVRTYLLTLFWSLGIWLAMFACFATLLTAIRLPQPYPLVVVGSTFATLAKALPLVTIGGFGAHEAGWALGFSLTGMAPALAISSGFAVNILILLLSAISGGSALLYLTVRGRFGDESLPVQR